LWQWVLNQKLGDKSTAEKIVDAHVEKIKNDKEIGVSDLLVKIFGGYLSLEEAEKNIRAQKVADSIIRENLAEAYFYYGVYLGLTGDTKKSEEYYKLSAKQNILRSQECVMAHALTQP
jgi:lipoprotein NlpI